MKGNPPYKILSFKDTAYWSSTNYRDILVFMVYEDRWPNYIDYRVDVAEPFTNAYAFLNNKGILIFRNKNVIDEK